MRILTAPGNESFIFSELFVQPVTGAGTSCDFGNPNGKGDKKSLEARTV